MNRIVVIAPHMDDEVLGCGGTIARHLYNGDYVTVIIVANRAYNNCYDDVLIAREKKSTEKAKNILGYNKIFYLDLPDERLDCCLQDIIIPIEKCLTEINPDIVYTCHGYDTNQDHQAVFNATLVACRPISPYKIKKFYSYEVPSSTDQIPPISGRQFLPSKYTNIENYIDIKLEAMNAYTEEMREFPHPRSIEGINIYAMKRGMEVGFKYAEAFQLLRELDE
jgi:LmbE family N-acetylglucosaminyl deacetylase